MIHDTAKLSLDRLQILLCIKRIAILILPSNQGILPFDHIAWLYLVHSLLTKERKQFFLDDVLFC